MEVEDDASETSDDFETSSSYSEEHSNIPKLEKTVKSENDTRNDDSDIFKKSEHVEANQASQVLEKCEYEVIRDQRIKELKEAFLSWRGPRASPTL